MYWVSRYLDFTLHTRGFSHIPRWTNVRESDLGVGPVLPIHLILPNRLSDFSLWQHVKNLVSAEEIQVDINHLRQWIIACVAIITPQTCWPGYVKRSLTAKMCAVPQAGTNLKYIKIFNVKFCTNVVMCESY